MQVADEIRLADEIRDNPDKSWSSSFMERYKSFLRSRNVSDKVEPVETWRDGAIEFTEAFLRTNGFAHKTQD
jgi:hypothetical protein